MVRKANPSRDVARLEADTCRRWRKTIIGTRCNMFTRRVDKGVSDAKHTNARYGCSEGLPSRRSS